jgi:nucleoside-diphosphate-sugar epimerase
MVGKHVLARLTALGFEVFAFTRAGRDDHAPQAGVNWRSLKSAEDDSLTGELSTWISLCPIWVLTEHSELLRRSGARRVVALSSTSRFTKTFDAGSRDIHENALAKRLEQGESDLICWAEQNEVEWVILRPTLIYDLVNDRNLSQIAAFIRRYEFFPLLGKAQGRRQPVHVKEVVDAVLAAVKSPSAANQDYNISGGETMTYREMVERIFNRVGKPPRFIQVPIAGFHIAIWLARIFPKYRHLSGSMAQRMSQDLVFDHAKAQSDLGYSPGKFLSVQSGDE